MKKPQAITIFTRRAPKDTEPSLRRIVELAAAEGVEARIPPEEVEKHGLEDLSGAALGADPDGDTDLAVVLGGDGTILSTLRRFAGRDVPVFAVNFGAIGFLATVDRSDLDDGMRRALAGELDVLPLPALVAGKGSEQHLAVNDLSFHRRPQLRVAELGYSVLGHELGQVRCDGLVVATPAGSTGYNLANGGPVLAWGVEGYVVSFIAPHTLTARAGGGDGRVIRARAGAAGADPGVDLLPPVPRQVRPAGLLIFSSRARCRAGGRRRPGSRSATTRAGSCGTRRPPSRA